MARIGLHAYFRTLKQETTRDAQSLLKILLVAVGIILLIACVNLANLLLVRAAGRKREFGVRFALGATSRAMFWQVISESLMLSLIGGIAGTGLVVLLVRTALLFCRSRFLDCTRSVSIGQCWPSPQA